MSRSSQLVFSAFTLLLLTSLTASWGEAIALSLVITHLNPSTFVTVLVLDAVLWSIVSQLHGSLQLRLKNVAVLVGTCIAVIAAVLLARSVADGYIMLFLASRIVADTLRHYTKTYLLPIYMAQHRREQFIKLMVGSRAVASMLSLSLIPLAITMNDNELMNFWVGMLGLTILSLVWLDTITQGTSPLPAISEDYFDAINERASFGHLRGLLQNGLIRWLTISAFSVTLLSTLVLYQTVHVLNGQFDHVSSLITFFVGLHSLGTVIILPLQYRLSSLRQFSASKLTLIYPSLLSAATLSLLAVPSIIIAAFGTIVRSNLRQNIHEPIERLLIHALSGGKAQWARLLLRTLVDPFGRLVGSLLIAAILTASRSPDMVLWIIAAGFGVAYIGAAQRAGFLYGQALANSLRAGSYRFLRHTASEWELSDHTRVQQLIEQIQDNPISDERERLLIAEVIARSELEEGYPILVDLYQQSPTFQQAELLSLIINGWPDKCSDKSNRRLVLQALESEDPVLRRQALRLVAAYPELDPDFTVTRFLLDPDADVNVLAASILLQHPSARVQNAARAQLRWLAKEQHVSTRVLAVQSLVHGSLDNYGDVVAPIDVSQYLNDPATRVREAILPAANIDQLIEAACNSSTPVRTTAIYYLRQRRLQGSRRQVLHVMETIRQQTEHTGNIQIELNLRHWRLQVALASINGGVRRKHLLGQLHKGFDQLSLLEAMQQTIQHHNQPAFLPLSQQLERDWSELLNTMIDYLGVAIGKSRADAIMWTLRSETAESAVARRALQNLTTSELATQFQLALRNKPHEPDSPRSSLPTVVFKTLLAQSDEWHLLLTVYCLSKLPLNIRQNWLDGETVERILAMGTNSPHDVVRESTRLIQKTLDNATRHDQRMVDEGVMMLSTLERMLFLRNVSFFRNLHLDQLRALARGCEEVTAEEGQYLIRQGEVGDGLYIIVEGEVRIERQTPSGHTVTLGHMRQSEVFGEISLLDGDVRTADVIADQSVLLLAIHRNALYAALEDDPQIAMTMLQTMARRLRLSNDMIEQQLSTSD